VESNASFDSYEKESESSSEYITSSDEEDSMEFNKRPIKSYDELASSLILDDLVSLIESFEINKFNINQKEVIEWVIKFHKIAIICDVKINSPRYRYLLKRIYIEFLRASVPNYGDKIFKISKLLFKSADSKANKEFLSDLLLSVSIEGIKIFDKESFHIVFHCPLCDLQECKLSEVDNKSST
jgi:hypothetical protein